MNVEPDAFGYGVDTFMIRFGYGKILINAFITYMYHNGCFVRVDFLYFLSKFGRGFYGTTRIVTVIYGNIRIRYKLLRIDMEDLFAVKYIIRMRTNTSVTNPYMYSHLYM